MTTEILLASILANFVIAFINTLNKEKRMIEEGGKPLPSSSYVFLVLRFLLWALVTYFVVELSTVTLTGWVGMLFYSGVLIGTYIVAIPLEVIIRTAFVLFYRKRMIKELEKKENNRAE